MQKITNLPKLDGGRQIAKHESNFLTARFSLNTIDLYSWLRSKSSIFENVVEKEAQFYFYRDSHFSGSGVEFQENKKEIIMNSHF